MTMKLVGMGKLKTSFDKYLKNTEKRIIDIRRRVAQELIEAIIGSVPVWSGRSVRSVEVSNDGSGSGNASEVHPDRRDRARDGPWMSHPEWDNESQRPKAEAIAKGTLRSTKFELGERVFITSNAYNWGDIDSGFPEFSNSKRVKPIISEIAIAQVKSMFGGLVK